MNVNSLYLIRIFGMVIYLILNLLLVFYYVYFYHIQVFSNLHHIKPIWKFNSNHHSKRSRGSSIYPVKIHHPDGQVERIVNKNSNISLPFIITEISNYFSSNSESSNTSTVQNDEAKSPKVLSISKTIPNFKPSETHLVSPLSTKRALPFANNLLLDADIQYHSNNLKKSWLIDQPALNSSYNFYMNEAFDLDLSSWNDILTMDFNYYKVATFNIPPKVIIAKNIKSESSPPADDKHIFNLLEEDLVFLPYG